MAPLSGLTAIEPQPNLHSSNVSDDATYRSTHTLDFLNLYVIKRVALCLELFSRLNLQRHATFKTDAQPKPHPFVLTPETQTNTDAPNFKNIRSLLAEILL